jgi:hypothetical protein
MSAATRWLPPSIDPGIGQLDDAALARTVEHLDRAGAALEQVPDRALEEAWSAAVAAFGDPRSPERRALDPALRAAAALSQSALDAGLEALLHGFSPAVVRALLERGRARRGGNGAPRRRRPHLVVLAANLPGLALQPLAAGLALRRPALLKSSSREPYFAPAFCAALARREPRVGEAIAAAAWRGGDRAVEGGLMERLDRVVVYGDADTLADLGARVGSRLIGFGPKLSIGVVERAGDLDLERRVAAGLARDVALFEQRGCLSLHAVYTDGDADRLADLVTAELDDLAARWPPVAASTSEVAAVRHLREEASFAGHRVTALPIERGTVVVDPRALLHPSPGGRTVSIHPVARLPAVLEILAPFAGKLQGAALAGRDAWALQPELERLGVSRCAEPGALQSPDAAWSNGGIDLLDALGD